MQVEDRRVARLAPVDLEPGDLGVALGDLHARGSYHHARDARRPPQASRDPRPAPQGVRPPAAAPARAPVDELILTVLSQNTNDRNRDVAYARLRERFPSWDDVRAAPVEEVEDAIRPGGLAPTKAVRIKQILDALGDDDLDLARGTPRSTRRATTSASCPAWAARRPPACCCSRSGARTCPVDTHVYRVGARLGLWPQKAPLDEAHDEMLRLVGRRRRGGLRDARAPDPPRPPHLRRARPRCADCPLRRMCPEGRRRRVERARSRRRLAPRAGCGERSLAVPFLIGIAVL